MAIPDTSNVSLLFVTRQPAWESGVECQQAMGTDLQTSRAGLEQRQQRSGRGRWQMTYRAFLNRTEQAAREARALAEIAAPLVVPWWTEASQTAGPVAGDVVQIDRAATLDFYAPGDWVFFDSPTEGQQFREIGAIGGTDQTLELVEMDGGIDFAAGTRIYPCRFAVRDQGQADFETASEATHLETLVYSTI